MLRQPAVCGRFYPSNAEELERLVLQYAPVDKEIPRERVKACLAPHAGYIYSGKVAGSVYGRIVLPRKIVILGVRHFPRGEQAAILSEGAWRTPLGDAPVDSELAKKLLEACASLKEDSAAHSVEHSLEVQLPFLQVLDPGFAFVPVALGMLRYDLLAAMGAAIAGVLRAEADDVLLLATSDLNHYEDDLATRRKDRKALEALLAMDARALYDTCRTEGISMCGLAPAVVTLTALHALGATRAELISYATSADVNGDRSSVVGYAGMAFA
jgi:AmmeMemoRadiSam system protein B